MLFLQDLNDNEGSFISLEHWYEPGTNCSYLLQGSTSQLVRLHFEKMKISKKTEIQPDDGHCGEYLILYDDDWANPQRIIKAMLHQNINYFLVIKLNAEFSSCFKLINTTDLFSATSVEGFLFEIFSSNWEYWLYQLGTQFVCQLCIL